MSGTLEKRADGSNRRQVRTQKEQQEKRKVRIIAISVVSVLILLFLGALFINSKLARRTIAAINIGGVNFTAAEFDYFYQTAFYEYREQVNQMMGDYASSMLPTTDKPFSSQINNSSGELWSETFIGFAIERMSELVRYYNASIAAGYTLSDEKRAEMEGEIETYRSQAQMYGFQSLAEFIKAMYGADVDEAVFRKVTEFIYIAQAYSTYIYDSFSYSASELNDYYLENKDNLDCYTYRYFLVKSETVNESDYETPELFEEAKAEALTQARDMAVQYLASIETEEDFIAAAADYDPVSYAEPDSTLRTYSGSSLGSYYGPWMMEPGRVYGETYAADLSTGTYAVFFIERDENEYRMTEMRQLLVLRDEINAEDYEGGAEDPEYLQAFADADTKAREEAESMYELFVSTGGTREILIGMMPDNSDDTTEGGFYDKISKDPSQSKMVPEIESWLFDPARKQGDYELIRTEAYGYHLVFFEGYGEVYKDFVADSRLRNKDLTEWKDGLEPVEADKRWGFALTQL